MNVAQRIDLWHSLEMPESKLNQTLITYFSDSKTPTIHRDISWLQFNERVLEEASPQSGNPLLERVKFLAITSSNLDEFFMIRFASLNRSVKSKTKTPEEIQRLEKIRYFILSEVDRFVRKQTILFNELIEELKTHKIFICPSLQDPKIYEAAKKIFEKQILPLLSPPQDYDLMKALLSPNLKMVVFFEKRLWFDISRSLPTMFSYEEETSRYYFFLDHLLAEFLGPTFGISEAPSLIRLTRDADIPLELDEQDTTLVPDKVLKQLGYREKGQPIRLQYAGALRADPLKLLTSYLKLGDDQVFSGQKTLLLHGLWGVVKSFSQDTAEAKKLTYKKVPGLLPEGFKNPKTLFKLLDKHDFLLHHPYDSFDAFIAFIKAAVSDPSVTMIQQTIYRVDSQSPILDLLKKAAKQGKRVRVFIELRARFDEFNNLKLADELRKAGVEVGFGLPKLKLHAKIALISRVEAEQVRYYTHFSTGNYNANTAKLYTDLAILSANQELGEDAKVFFDSIWESKLPAGLKKILIAPNKLHRKLLSLIENETDAAIAGKPTRILVKVNALVDEEVIAALYRASQAGVKIDLIVRGACSLIPRIKGLSENIRVLSIVDRFLEHSRIYYFASSKSLYLSSADWMPRNFFSRLEIAFPILDPLLYQFIEQTILPNYLADTCKARELTSQGLWKKVPTKVGHEVRSQFVFEELASKGYQGTTLADRILVEKPAELTQESTL